MENLGFPSTPCVTAKPLAIVVKPKIVTFSDFSVYAALQHKMFFFSAVVRIAAARCEAVCSFFGGGRKQFLDMWNLQGASMVDVFLLQSLVKSRTKEGF